MKRRMMAILMIAMMVTTCFAMTGCGGNSDSNSDNTVLEKNDKQEDNVVNFDFDDENTDGADKASTTDNQSKDNTQSTKSTQSTKATKPSNSNSDSGNSDKKNPTKETEDENGEKWTPVV